MIVYQIKNKINKKSYIGCAVGSLEKRMREHLCSARKGNLRPVYCAIRKYGIQSFSIRVIDSAESQKVLFEKERYWISKCGSLAPNGYNLTLGGDGAEGYKFTKKALLNLSRSHKGIRLSEETKRVIGALHKGVPESEATKAAISRGVKRHWKTRKQRSR